MVEGWVRYVSTKAAPRPEAAPVMRIVGIGGCCWVDVWVCGAVERAVGGESDGMGSAIFPQRARVEEKAQRHEY